MSAEASFNYFHDGDASIEADGISAVTHAIHAGTGNMKNQDYFSYEPAHMRVVSIDEFKDLAPEEVETLKAEGWTNLSFYLRIDTNNVGEAEEFVKEHETDLERAKEGFEHVSDDQAAEWAREAAIELVEDVGAHSHIAISKPLRELTPEEERVIEAVQSGGGDHLAYKLASGPMLTAVLNETNAGDDQVVVIDKGNLGDGAITEAKVPEELSPDSPRMSEYRGNIAPDFISADTWETVQRLRDLIFNAATTYIGQRHQEEQQPQ